MIFGLNIEINSVVEICYRLMVKQTIWTIYEKVWTISSLHTEYICTERSKELQGFWVARQPWSNVHPHLGWSKVHLQHLLVQSTDVLSTSKDPKGGLLGNRGHLLCCWFRDQRDAAVNHFRCQATDVPKCPFKFTVLFLASV